jgi:2-oxoglutarate ferredoxin oxidoreductase subunit alpha
VQADPKGVLTGTHYLDGDHAAAEGACAAGCRFFAGYPITPSTEIAERCAMRFPMMGGQFIQMEDEIASIAAVLGGSWGGLKSITVTSGPGFSLMMENIGLAVMMECPCVIVNVQRGGPSTGLPTLPAQSDMMQARWGSHGDYEIIALSPNSPQECFDLTIEAVNLSEQYRLPVLLMMDECVGHMTEKVVIPKAEKIELVPRRYTTLPPKDYLPYKPGEDLIPDLAPLGKGYRFHTTGLTHDERGYPVMNAECQAVCVGRLVDKIRKNADKIYHVEKKNLDKAEVVIVSYGISSRVAIPAIEKANAEGIKVGEIRLVTVWPFPDKLIREVAGNIKAFVVPEINLGQMVNEVERCASGKCITRAIPHAGGWVHDPEQIYQAIKEVSK